MESIFLSCHFGVSDQKLVRRVERLLESHNLRVVMGDVLGGGALTPTIMNRIEKKSDGLVALMTKRDQDPTYGGTHPWVVDEFKHAKGNGKRAICMVWPEVNIAGAYAAHERIVYDPVNELDAFLKLSETIGLWQEQEGRLIKAQVLPDELAEGIAGGNGLGSCKFRLFGRDGVAGDWKEGRIVPEGDGTYVYLKELLRVRQSNSKLNVKDSNGFLES